MMLLPIDSESVDSSGKFDGGSAREILAPDPAAFAGLGAQDAYPETVEAFESAHLRSLVESVSSLMEDFTAVRRRSLRFCARFSGNRLRIAFGTMLGSPDFAADDVRSELRGEDLTALRQKSAGFRALELLDSSESAGCRDFVEECTFSEMLQRDLIDVVCCSFLIRSSGSSSIEPSRNSVLLWKRNE
jgi:hypothetical protein